MLTAFYCQLTCQKYPIVSSSFFFKHAKVSFASYRNRNSYICFGCKCLATAKVNVKTNMCGAILI